MKNRFFKDLINGEKIYLLDKKTLNILSLEVTPFHLADYEKYGETVIAESEKYIKFTSYEDAVSVKNILETLSKNNKSTVYKVSVSHAEIIEIFSAYKKGQTIQYKKLYNKGGYWCGTFRGTNMDDNYIDIDKNHVFDFYEFDYRIKPELLCKYRPYKNALEFINASKEHGPYITTNGQEYVKPTFVGSDMIGVFYDNNYYHKFPYEKLLEKNMHWQDGTVCGICIK